MSKTMLELPRYICYCSEQVWDFLASERRFIFLAIITVVPMPLSIQVTGPSKCTTRRGGESPAHGWGE